MKKVSLFLFVLFFGAVTNSFAQTSVATTPTATPEKAVVADFFAGKWDVVFIGTPNGDAKLMATFTRTDGKLTGELTSTESKEPIPMTDVQEESDKISFGFSAQGYDLTLSLEKVDADNLKGMLMNMFESKAVRVKE